MHVIWINDVIEKRFLVEYRYRNPIHLHVFVVFLLQTEKESDNVHADASETASFKEAEAKGKLQRLNFMMHWELLFSNSLIDVTLI